MCMCVYNFRRFVFRRQSVEEKHTLHGVQVGLRNLGFQSWLLDNDICLFAPGRCPELPKAWTDSCIQHRLGNFHELSCSGGDRDAMRRQ